MRRILPALFLVTAFSVPFALVILVPENLEDFGQSVIASALFVSNFFFYLEDGYFEGPAELHPLLHTWSLAVEEQFYLLLPLLLLFAFRRNASLSWLLGTTALASFAFSIWQVNANASAAFYLLPARLWELMLGSLLAVAALPRPANPTLATGITTLGIGLILLAVGAYDETTPFPGAAAVLPCLGAALIIYGGETANAASRALALPPWRGIGLISYSLYLWHFPLLVFARHLLVRPFTAIEIIALLTLTALLSWWSWRFIEQPFRRAERIAKKQLLQGVGAAISVAIAVGLFTDFSDGAEWRFSDQARGYLAANQDKDSSCLRRRERCELGPAGEPRFLVWGDSHAGSILPAFQVLSEQHQVSGKALLRGGCPPLKGYYLRHVIADSCKASIEQTIELLEDPAIDTVFLAARWTMAVEQSTYGYEGGSALKFYRDGDPSLTNAEVVELAFEDTLTAISRPGREVYLIGPIPEIGWHVPATMAQRERLGTLLDEVTIAPSQADFDVR
ncbi:MAG: acyltransferase family protein, partial [Pseudomonadota bacterium]